MCYMIRAMEERDIPSRVLVQCRAWMETYRGLIPDAVLDSMTPGAVEAAVRTLPMETLVVDGPGGLVGFACFAPEARAFTGRQNTAEVAALYLLRQGQGCGLGRRLMEAVLGLLPPYRDVVLYVLDGNRQAIAFYEHMGFSPTGRVLRQPVEGGELVEREMLLKRREA